MLLLAIFPDPEMLQFWSVNYIFILDMSKILDNIYILVFIVNRESVLLLTFVKYILYSHCTEHCIFCNFWRLKTHVL